MNTITLAPPHAIVFIYDPSHEGADTPEFIEDKAVSANSACISVITLAEVDGKTTISLEKDSSRIVVTDLKQIFRGQIETPGKAIAVGTSEMETLLQSDVASTKADVEVWVDDEQFPSRIVVFAA